MHLVLWLYFYCMLVITTQHNYIHKTKVHFFVFLIYFMHLINARNMEDIKQYIYSKYILIMPSHLQLHIQITPSQSYTYISHHPLPCCTSHQTRRLHLKVLVLFRATVHITKLIASFSSLRCNFLSRSSKHSSFYPTLKQPQK
jgi:hypothetical protein